MQVELNKVAVSESMKEIPLTDIYFMIRNFKLIITGLVLEKKPKKQVFLNTSSSSYWNKHKDGLINFSYEAKHSYLMLTLFGLERPKSDNNPTDD